MFKRNKNILRHYPTDISFPDIQSSKNFIPDWYKKTKVFVDTNKEPNILPYNKTLKACTPFLESFTTGYMIPLSVDIAIKQTENGPIVSWNQNNITVVEKRHNNINSLLPIPEGYSDLHFVWKTQHSIDIPNGYSFLITHPLNRMDLPFFTLSAVVDGKFTLFPGSVPVFFSRSFEGVIKAGTPIAQVIPFKTENWSSIKDPEISHNAEILMKQLSNDSFGLYKQKFWKRKKYD